LLTRTPRKTGIERRKPRPPPISKEKYNTKNLPQTLSISPRAGRRASLKKKITVYSPARLAQFSLKKKQVRKKRRENASTRPPIRKKSTDGDKGNVKKKGQRSHSGRQTKCS